MRTRWQRVMMGMVLGLILALAAGRVVLAEEQPKDQGWQNEPGLEIGSQPGSTAPAAPAPAPAPAEGATAPAPVPAPAAGATAPAPVPASESPFEEGPALSAPAVPAPAVPAPPAGQQQYRLHRVGKDENLHILAAYYYGDARQWPKVYNLNKKAIRNPNVLHEGQMLKIEVPPGWQPRFSLPEFMDKERKRIASQGLPAQAKPKVIHETQEIQVIPRLLPAEEGEGAPEEKPKAEEGRVNIPSTGETPGVSIPTQAPASPLNPESGGTAGK